MKAKYLKSKKLYMAVINLGGFVHPDVYELYLTESKDGHWDEEGDYGFLHEDNQPLGIKWGDRGGIVEFLSTDKKEAETFLSGALTAKKFLLDMIR
jgi:hypothetical protein